MGTWGVGSFDNDQALDFAATLQTTDDDSYLRECLIPKQGSGFGHAVAQGGYLDSCIGTDIIAAAEVLAAILGRPSGSLPSDVSSWAQDHRTLEASVLAKAALPLLDQVLSGNSELRELWEENVTKYPAWRDAMLDLKIRLAT